jgi:hypothetical protein
MLLFIVAFSMMMSFLSYCCREIAVSSFDAAMTAKLLSLSYVEFPD